jgi:uncharacterized protein (DUF1697 family)
MDARVALLRGVNVGGRGRIPMADLRELFVTLGFSAAKTLLQSGNVVFASDGQPPALEQLLERESASRLGLSTDYFVRTAAEWREVLEHNPFPEAAASDPSHLLVIPLKTAPAAADLKSLQSAIKGRETIAGWERHLYVVYPDGIGTSKLTLAVIEGRLGTRGTGRNWNTAQKLAALMVG